MRERKDERNVAHAIAVAVDHTNYDRTFQRAAGRGFLTVAGDDDDVARLRGERGGGQRQWGNALARGAAANLGAHALPPGPRTQRPDRTRDAERIGTRRECVDCSFSGHRPLNRNVAEGTTG